MKTIFPIILIILDCCAGFVYLRYGDFRHFLYWMFAAGLTACVTF